MSLNPTNFFFFVYLRGPTLKFFEILKKKREKRGIHLSSRVNTGPPMWMILDYTLTVRIRVTQSDLICRVVKSVGYISLFINSHKSHYFGYLPGNKTYDPTFSVLGSENQNRCMK